CRPGQYRLGQTGQLGGQDRGLGAGRDRRAPGGGPRGAWGDSDTRGRGGGAGRVWAEAADGLVELGGGDGELVDRVAGRGGPADGDAPGDQLVQAAGQREGGQQRGQRGG